MNEGMNLSVKSGSYQMAEDTCEDHLRRAVELCVSCRRTTGDCGVGTLAEGRREEMRGER